MTRTPMPRTSIVPQSRQKSSRTGPGPSAAATSGSRWDNSPVHALHRRSREHVVSLRGGVVTAISCAGMVAFYLSWRLGAVACLRAGSVPAPLRHTAQLLWGAARGLLRRPRLAASEPAACAGHPSSSGFQTVTECAPGYYVCRIQLPPLTGTDLIAAASATTPPSASRAIDAAPGVEERQERHGEAAGTEPADARQSRGDGAADTWGQQVGSEECLAAGEQLEVHVLDLQVVPHGALAESLSALVSDAGLLGVLGLDAEWEPELLPGVRHRISVVQLSTANRCWVLKLAWQGHGPQHHDSTGDPHAAAAAGTVPDADSSASVAAARPLPAGLPGPVAALLTDPRVIKAGVGIQEDVRRLGRDLGLQVRGAVDIRLVAQRVAPDCLAAGSSLRALSASLLGRLLDKSQQRSHWGADHLDAHQIAYAAHDAWLSRELLCELFRRHDRFQQTVLMATPMPPVADVAPSTVRNAATTLSAAAAAPATAPAPVVSPAAGVTAAAAGAEGAAAAASSPTPALSQQPQPHQRPGHRQVHLPASVQDFAAAFADVFSGIKTRKVERVLGPQAAAREGWQGADAKAAGSLAAVGAMGEPQRRGVAGPSAGAGVEGGEGTGSREVRRKQARKLPTRKSALYENCRLLAPDGAVLCTCGSKKVQWYLGRGLARVVSDNPITIQLNFEPRGRGHADDQYYLADKENRCCACGVGGEYLRHSVVPHCYRQHFPTYMKSHLSHDIVLLCTACHKVSSVLDQRRMEVLAAQYNAPLGAATAAKFRHDSNLGALRSAGRALSNTKVVIPPARRRELEELVASYFGVAVEQLDEELVRQAADVDPRTEDENWRSHAELVVRALGGRAEVEAFVRGWRQHFLETMRPRFLPPHWRVDARVANSAGD